MTEPVAKKETVVETVTMEDGHVVDFPGKKKMQKDSYISPTGEVSIRMDFRNGRTLTKKLRSDMLAKYAAHGAEQKYGDEIAGVDDIDDCYLAVEELGTRLDAGEWSIKREGSGMSGTSVLLRAIVNVTGKSIDAVKAFLATKTQAQKLALRESAKFAAEVAKLEAEKAKTKVKVDITADLEELDQLPA